MDVLEYWEPNINWELFNQATLHASFWKPFTELVRLCHSYKHWDEAAKYARRERLVRPLYPESRYGRAKRKQEQPRSAVMKITNSVQPSLLPKNLMTCAPCLPAVPPSLPRGRNGSATSRSNARLSLARDMSAATIEQELSIPSTQAPNLSAILFLSPNAGEQPLAIPFRKSPAPKRSAPGARQERPGTACVTSAELL
jgi:hypothetical protein